jgi:hypothetical protein
MAIHCSDDFSGATGNLLGRTSDGPGAGVWAQGGNSDTIGSALVFDSAHRIYCQTPDGGNGYYVDLPVSGTVGSSLQIIEVLTLLGGGNGKHGCCFGRTSSNAFDLAAGWDFTNSRWFVDVIGFQSNAKTETLNPLGSTGTYTLTFNLVVGGGNTTITVYNGSTQVITYTFSNTFAVANPALVWVGVTDTATTGFHVVSIVSQDIPTTPTGLALVSTGFVVTSGTATVSTIAGNLNGNAGADSETPLLVSFVGSGSTLGTDTALTVTISSGNGTISASPKIPAGQTSALVYLKAAKADIGTTVTITVAAPGLTSVTLNVPVVTNVGVIFGNSIGASFGLSDVRRGYAFQVSIILAADWAVYNFSVPSITTPILTTNAANQINTSTGLPGSGKNRCALQELINDMNAGSSAATAYANAQAFATQSTGYGFTTDVLSAQARTSSGSYPDSRRLTLNTLLVGITAIQKVNLIPFGTDARYNYANGPGGGVNNYFYQSDNLHFSDAGHSAPATYIAEAWQPGSTGAPSNLGITTPPPPLPPVAGPAPMSLTPLTKSLLGTTLTSYEAATELATLFSAPNADAAYSVAGKQVVTTQQPLIAAATDAASVITSHNAVLAALKTHGLIASS